MVEYVYVFWCKAFGCVIGCVCACVLVCLCVYMFVCVCTFVWLCRCVCLIGVFLFARVHVCVLCLIVRVAVGCVLVCLRVVA